MIAANVYLNLIQPSLGRIPLFIVAVQFMLEVVVCCTMFEKLEQQVRNLKIPPQVLQKIRA